MYQFGNLINGQWVSEGTTLGQTYSPADTHLQVGAYNTASPELVNRATACASQAQRAWRQLPVATRNQTIERFIDACIARAEELAQAITAEQGKPLAEARAEVAKASSEARFMLAHALAASGARSVPGLRPRIRTTILRRPRGVIVAITPWNFPVMTPMRKIIPALAFGNAIIVKPSEFSPAAMCLLGEIAQNVLPAGLLQIVHGNAKIGDLLVRHPSIRGVTFTGSVATGRRIRSATADNLAETALELGGKNAAIIHDTDDLEACLDQISEAALMSSGQRCTAISRVLVRSELAGNVIEGLAARAKAKVLGDGALPGTQLGPITHKAQLDHVDAMVSRAVKAGVRVVVGGQRQQVAGCDNGLFYAPTVLANVSPGMEIAREEVFGPVISVIEYASIDQALEILNDVDYGLTASLFANDIRVIDRFVNECETGMIHVNHGTIPDSHMPFGGIKASGVGAYSVGESASAFYTTEHSVYVGV